MINKRDLLYQGVLWAGLTLLSHETFLTYQFLLVFGLDQRSPARADEPGC